MLSTLGGVFPLKPSKRGRGRAFPMLNETLNISRTKRDRSTIPTAIPTILMIADSAQPMAMFYDDLRLCKWRSKVTKRDSCITQERREIEEPFQVLYPLSLESLILGNQWWCSTMTSNYANEGQRSQKAQNSLNSRTERDSSAIPSVMPTKLKIADSTRPIAMHNDDLRICKWRSKVTKCLNRA